MSVSLVNAALAPTLAAGSVVITMPWRYHGKSGRRRHSCTPPHRSGSTVPAALVGIAAFTVLAIRLLGSILTSTNLSIQRPIVYPGRKSEFAYGRLWMLPDATNPVTDTMTPGVGLVLDNVTISSAPVGAAQLLPVVIDEIGQSGEYAGLVCIRID